MRSNTMEIRIFRNVHICSVNPLGGTKFTLKSTFGFRDLIREGLGAEAGKKPICSMTHFESLVLQRQACGV